MTGAHHAALAGFAFALGSSIGSFLNVCAWRLPRGESLIHPPSRCPRCGASIAARDNLPVLGWLLLRGRCRSCARPISARYPLVEATVGFLFAAVVLAATASGPLDPLDRGPWLVLARVGYHWSLVALLVTSWLIAHDRSFSISPSPPRSVLPLVSLAALFVGLLDGPIGVVLNLALLTVFLRGAVLRHG